MPHYFNRAYQIYLSLGYLQPGIEVSSLEQAYTILRFKIRKRYESLQRTTASEVSLFGKNWKRQRDIPYTDTLYPLTSTQVAVLYHLLDGDAPVDYYSTKETLAAELMDRIKNFRYMDPSYAVELNDPTTARGHDHPVRHRLIVPSPDSFRTKILDQRRHENEKRRKRLLYEPGEVIVELPPGMNTLPPQNKTSTRSVSEVIKGAYRAGDALLGPRKKRKKNELEIQMKKDLNNR